ncbi:MAG: diacylglycerol kinase family protein [Candidatus Dormiibacterota bacterium]
MSESAVLVNAARVANPAALRRSIARALSDEGWSVPGWFETTRGESGEATAQRAAAAGIEVLFVCGGDGTVGAAAAALAGTETAIAVIPSGTGNLLALNLGLPTDIAGAVRLATRGGRRRIDLGEVDGRTFTVAAGIGLDAQILADTPHRAKHHLGWTAYAAAAVPHLRDPRFRAEVRLDGGPTIERDVRSVLVANVGRLPGGITLLPSAVPDDGLLDVALIAPSRSRDWATLLASLIGRHPKGGRIETFRVERVEITTADSQPREVDGESLPWGARLAVQVRPHALTVCVRPALPRAKA